ncbi:MAG: amino acid ABC transporter substrate-binding protein [Rhodoplanes sp.]|uniref:amino acid ABC transporter substrate-binding protein n=1 Tax=Rhodoplanes sp. TaxID=1968906 RepID=UPI0017FD020E|nr:amino acid ABC transporter substrate-binding protein [Rhodoplanes sp.]NVO16376.1 amino acid ABC transporter substrate-binding protein [Rhodoplanes sp.]
MRRVSAAIAIAAAGFWALSGAAIAQSAPDKIKIGYAISKTGPFTGGASITTLPVYELWVKEVNAAGGIKIGDKRVPIEVVEYDDRSNSEEAIKAIERLASQDKVDFILPPWSTGLNLAVGPILNRLGYPHLAVTTNTNRAPELAKRWPNASFWLGLPADISVEMVAVLSKLRADGKIGPTVAMIGVSDQFGIELTTAARDAFAKAGFKLAYDKSYPAGSQDMQPMLKDAMAANPDVFVSFSYPPDTLAVTDAAKVLGFNPKVFFTGVGTAFPLFKQRFGANAEGVMGIGGWNADSPLLKDYLARHKAGVGREPDRWANPVTFASLQALQQAIERVGLDRAAVVKELQSGTFDTIIGKVKLEGGLLKDVWAVGQWQSGEFYGVAPSTKDGARAPVVPKPAWGP